MKNSLNIVIQKYRTMLNTHTHTHISCKMTTWRVDVMTLLLAHQNKVRRGRGKGRE